MAKRFTSTEKWDDKWFRSLTPHQKLLFNYFCDKCDMAGFLEIDYLKITFDTGLNEPEILGAIEGLNRGCLGANNNEWIWVKNFVRHQKNLPINPDNNAHKNILSCLSSQVNRFDVSEIMDYLGANQGLISPIGKGKDKGKDKDLTEKEILFSEIVKNLSGNGKTPDEVEAIATKTVEEDFNQFIRITEWIEKNAPRVADMKEPITLRQFVKIREEIKDKSKITELLKNMQNWKPLLQKNVSAYQTLLNWSKREN